MKKLFLSLAVVCSVALISCGGNKAKEEAAEETTPVVEEVAVVEVATDTNAPAGDTIENVEAAGVAAEAPAETPAQ